MIPGKNRWRVDLQRFAATPDAYRQPIKAWSTVGTYWAEIATLTGREAVNARQIKAETTHKVTMRHLGTGQTITAQDRLAYKTRVFNVLWVDNVGERNRELNVYCQEVVSPP